METIKVYVGWSDGNFCACINEHIGGVLIVIRKNLKALRTALGFSLAQHLGLCLSCGDALEDWVVSGNYRLEYELSYAARHRRLQFKPRSRLTAVEWRERVQSTRAL